MSPEILLKLNDLCALLLSNWCWFGFHLFFLPGFSSFLFLFEEFCFLWFIRSFVGFTRPNSLLVFIDEASSIRSFLQTPIPGHISAQFSSVCRFFSSMANKRCCHWFEHDKWYRRIHSMNIWTESMKHGPTTTTASKPTKSNQTKKKTRNLLKIWYSVYIYFTVTPHAKLPLLLLLLLPFFFCSSSYFTIVDVELWMDSNSTYI